MKILIVNQSDIEGGAARSAYRLHTALQMLGIKSQMLVRAKISDDYTVISTNKANLPKKIIAKLASHIEQKIVQYYRRKDTGVFTPARYIFSDIIKRINSSDADIIHLHWIAGGLMRIEDFAKIKKPIVWSLLDMWAFTGGCHYDNHCNKYMKLCNLCPALGSYKNHDLSFSIFMRKKRIFKNISGMTIIGHSKWLTDCAKRSYLLKDKQVMHIPSPIDTNSYKPIEKKTSREILGLHEGLKLVVFGAMNAHQDVRKGYNELTGALTLMKSENVEFMVFGATRPQYGNDLKYPLHFLGRLHDDISMRVVYSAADVVVVPSLQENLSNVILESLACGTPVVGFKIGGNPDMIEHKINGYLAEPFDAGDLAKGIDWVLNYPDPEEISYAAREKAVREFDSTVVAKKYLDCYKNVLGV